MTIAMKLTTFLCFIFAIFTFGYSQSTLKIEEGYVETKDDVNLYYQKIGSGPNKVIIPSGMYMAHEFIRLINQNRTILFYDQRGRGHSSKIMRKADLGIKYEISDLESIRNHFGYQRISLIGWSYSGAVVALYSAKYPQYVNRVIQIGPIPIRKNPYWEQYIKTNSTRLNNNDRKHIQEIFKKFEDANNTEEYIKQYYQVAHKPLFFGEVIHGKFREDFYSIENERPDNVWKFILPNIIESLGDWNFGSIVSSIETPFLTVHGSYDAFPIESAMEWSKSLLNGRFLIILDAGHLPWLEKPDYFYKAIDEFLSGDWPISAVKVNK